MFLNNNCLEVVYGKTVVELFAGVGGFRCGLNNVSLVNNKTVEDGNWNFVWANQWEPATKSQEAFSVIQKGLVKMMQVMLIYLKLIKEKFLIILF